MSVLSNFENKVEGAVDGAAAAMFSSPIEPAQIAKKAEKQMKREKLVGSGRQYAPTLYNVLVNERDDKRLFGFYPTMASEIENYLYAKGTDAGMEFDARPLVRFIPDPGLKKGRFDVIAEVVAAPIIKKLRAEELEYYGLAPKEAAVAMGEYPSAQGDAGVQDKRSPQGQRSTRGAQGGKNSIPSMAGAAGAYAGGAAVAPVSNKFAGLDVPVDVETDPDDYEPVQERARFDTGIAAPQSQRGSVSQRGFVSEDSIEFDNQAVIGKAMLYNCSDQKPHHLQNRKFTVGRGKDNEIMLADANASRVHARFSQDATGRWKLTDLDSTNGTLLNDRPVTSAILKSGDEITIGTTVLQFVE